MKKIDNSRCICLTKEEIEQVNLVQYEIFKEFQNVCNKLNIKYYAVHGTLLGAVRKNDFFPYDDDIDIAMPRKDYELLISKGIKYFSKDLFLQCRETEKDYPLVFAKLRNSKTAFIQPVLKDFNINKGIYIDIFPIDFYPQSKIKRLLYFIKDKVYTCRVNERFYKKKSIFKNICMFLLKIVLPDWDIAMNKKNNLYKDVKSNNSCIVYGGKLKEKNIDFELFGEGKKIKFKDIDIIVPDKYEEYLEIIYGDFLNYNPAKKYMNENDTVNISANIVDTNNSFLNYI